LSSGSGAGAGVQQDQRTRILEAIAAAIAKRDAGAGPVSAAALRRAAGTSSEAFDELFADREAAVLATFELALERVSAWVLPAYQAEPRWLDAIRAALGAFLRFLEAEPALGRLLVVHAVGAGPQVLGRRMEVLAIAAAAVDRGRSETPAGRQPPPAVIAEGAVGAVLAVTANRLPAVDASPPIELFGALSSMIVLPYLGSRVARRELTRPPPRLRAPEETPVREADELVAREAAGRLTYRTVRVLSAIHDYPGASNREVAQRSGIVDQGQISKLLGRLEVRELIVKRGEGRARGAPNAWRLTERGGSLMRSDGVRAALRTSADVEEQRAGGSAQRP
jgi:AcrR family transcriptional regulator